jgi:hypothetical protein
MHARYLFAIAATALLAAGCAGIPAIPVEGKVAEGRIGSTVDAEVARYYVEAYLPGTKARPDLDRRIDELTARHRGLLPTREDLVRIAAEFGSVDFAALFFADRLLADPCNRSVNDAFARHLADGRRRDWSAAPYRVLFVPGFDYVDHGHLTGADFGRPRLLARELGLDNALVEIPSTGSVERNAGVLAAAIRTHAASGKQLIIAGASSAGPAIHLALGELLTPKERSPVRAWLNLAGLLQGTPIIDWVREPPQGWFLPWVAAYKGYDWDELASMSTERSRRRFDRLRLDPAILVINYLGIPVSGSVGRVAADQYKVLRPLGPNDGLTLLPDALVPGGATIVALGRDHFLAEDPQIDARTVALMGLVIAMLENGRGRCYS